LRVLVTRPRFDAARTAQRLSSLGHVAFLDPLIEIEPLPFAAPKAGYAALVFTSANAVRTADSYEELKRLPAFAVGPRTAEVMRETGFQAAGVAQGDVNSLGELIAARLPAGAKVLHLAGEDRAGDLPGRLSQNGILTDVRVIYRARASKQLRPETVTAFKDKKIDAVLHYSERSAAIFLELTKRDSLSELAARARHFCISGAAASPLAALDVKASVASSPSEAALLDLLGKI